MTKPDKVIIFRRIKEGPETPWKKVVEVPFNPTEISLDKSVQIAEITIPGLDTPLLQFVRGQNERMTLDLFFDTTEHGMGDDALSVTEKTDKIYQLTKTESSTHAPPVCLFVWGKHFPGSNVFELAGGQGRNAFQCLIESVKQRFTLFSPRGVPLRATLTVTLREYRTLDEQLDYLNLESPDRTHSHGVQRGETLSEIAHRYYLRPGEWRPIAQANEIEDPRRLSPGMFLAIPPLT